MACYRGEGAKEIKVVKTVLVRYQGLYSSHRKYSSLHHHEPKAAFIHAIQINSAIAGKGLCLFKVL